MGNSKNSFYALVDYCNYHIKNSNEFNIVFTILRHVSDDVFPTLEQISEEAFISQASVLRVIHKIGFDTYDELRFSIAKEPPSILKKMQIRLLSRGITRIEDVANAEMQIAYDNIKRTADNIDYEALEELLGYIGNSDCTIFLGDNWVLANAKSLQMDLITGGITTILLEKQFFSLERLKDTNDKTVIIFNLISMVQLDDEALNIIRAFKDHGAKTVLMTQVPIEKIGEFAGCFRLVLNYGSMDDPLSGHYSLIFINRILGDRFLLRKLEEEKLI